jgi:hypothetical protein
MVLLWLYFNFPVQSYFIVSGEVQLIGEARKTSEDLQIGTHEPFCEGFQDAEGKQQIHQVSV